VYDGLMPSWFSENTSDKQHYNPGQVYSNLQTLFEKDCLRNGRTFSAWDLSGILRDGSSFAAWEKKIKSLGFGRASFYRSDWAELTPEPESETVVTVVYLGDHGVVQYQGPLTGTLRAVNVIANVSATVSQDKTREEMLTFLRANLQERPSKETGAPFLATTDSRGGLTFEQNLTSVGSPWVPTNYSKEVRAAYSAMLPAFASKNPSGKLVILNGAPGTGKSFLLQALLYDTRDRFCHIIMPPYMMHNITGPQTMSALLQHRNENTRKRTVFFLEDAEDALLVRQGDNHSAVSNILNLSDGMMGKILDIRIVATTNRKKVELDPALIRDERLLAHISVDPLSPEEAREAFDHVYPEKAGQYTPHYPTSLATVYKTAKSMGWTAPEPADKPASRGVVTQRQIDRDEAKVRGQSKVGVRAQPRKPHLASAPKLPQARRLFDNAADHAPLYAPEKVKGDNRLSGVGRPEGSLVVGRPPVCGVAAYVRQDLLKRLRTLATYPVKDAPRLSLKPFVLSRVCNAQEGASKDTLKSGTHNGRHRVSPG